MPKSVFTNIEHRSKRQKSSSDALHRSVTRWNKAKTALDKAQANYEKAQKNYKKAHGLKS